MSVTDEEYESAARVIRRHFYEWVRMTATELIKESFDFEGRDDFQEAIDSAVDSAMTYTKDHYETLFASEVDGVEGAEDSGIDVPTLAQIAYFSFRGELMGVLERDPIANEVFGDVSQEERQNAFLEDTAHLFYEKAGKRYFYIGTLNEGQNDELDFGVLIVDASDHWDFVGITGIASGKYGHDIRAAWDSFHERGYKPEFTSKLSSYPEVTGTDAEVATALRHFKFKVDPIRPGEEEFQDRAWLLKNDVYLVDQLDGDFIVIERTKEGGEEIEEHEIIRTGPLYLVLEQARETL